VGTVAQHTLLLFLELVRDQTENTDFMPVSVDTPTVPALAERQVFRSAEEQAFIDVTAQCGGELRIDAELPHPSGIPIFCLVETYSQGRPHIMEWKDEYSVGILEIDNQHKLLLRSFSVIEETIKLDQDWSNTHYAIVELIQLTRTHFSFEEALMRMFGYLETKAHQKDHQYFMVRLHRLERHAMNKSSEINMVQFLQDEVMAHILDKDKSFAKHLFSGAQVIKSGSSRDASRNPHNTVTSHSVLPSPDRVCRSRSQEISH